VKVAEVNRTVLKAIGVNWAKVTGTFQFVTQNPTTGQNITAQNLLQYAFRLPGSMGQLQATLDALAQENLLTTLAEPNLTATSGQTASFLAGGEFPIPVAVAPSTGTGFSTVTVEFKTFGVSLDFTPTIIDANHLSLRIRPEVSQLSANGSVQVSGFSIPALTVRRAETTVELGSGESFALAGLLQNSTTQNVSRLPWLGDIPVLGQLFRSDQFQRNESELIIIVTPYLVKPSATALAAPTDGFVPPHDAERIINSKTYRQALPAPSRGPVPRDGQGLVGPVGFRLD
jgi:pilus assembly protein CpaC